MKGERPTAAYVDLDALERNFAEARRLAAGRRVLAVVKADAYGHGAVPVARRLRAAGCDALAVATAAEAGALREARVEATLLVLGGVSDAGEAADVVAAGAVPVVHHAGQRALLARAARERGVRLPVQVEVDTGMRRMGIPAEDAPSWLVDIARDPDLSLDGVFTHLSCADEPDPAPTRAQLALFAEILSAARERGVRPRCIHVANSAGLLLSEEIAGSLPPEVNAVRPGLLLYGVLPAPFLRGRAALRPAMSLRTRVCHVRHVRRGDAVGYGASFRARGRGRIATVPVGYADGIPWSLGNRGTALLRGRRVPFAGRVSMDLVTLDVGDAPVEMGEEVVLFGTATEPPGASLPVEEVAEAAGTIPYELLVRVGRRVPRVHER